MIFYFCFLLTSKTPSLSEAIISNGIIAKKYRRHYKHNFMIVNDY